jgi:very-short-patch-repair endonuclease
MHGMRALERPHGLDARIAELADRQHGVVTWDQLAALGLGREAIARRVRAGRLHRLYSGVYSVGHRILSRHGRWLAAVLSRGPAAVLSHRSAAALWGIRDHCGGSIDVTSPSKAKSRGAIRAHHVALLPDEVTIEDTIPATTVPRTIFDLATDTPHAVEPALRRSEYLRLHDRLSLPGYLHRYPGHRGNKAIRAALARIEETTGRSRSDMEERFIRFIDHHGLPRPNLNAWLTIGPDRFQADCLWPAQRLIAELDSWSAHGTRSAFRSDKTRDRKLLAAGYATTRIAWSHLDDEPDAVATDLRTLLTSADPARPKTAGTR